MEVYGASGYVGDSLCDSNAISTNIGVMTVDVVWAIGSTGKENKHLGPGDGNVVRPPPITSLPWSARESWWMSWECDRQR